MATYSHGPGIDEPLEMNRAGSTYNYIADGLGSIIGLTDNTGSIVQQYVYSSFGKIEGVFDGSGTDVTAAPPVENFYTFAGREYDKESGNYYNRARYYNGSLGRFLSEDPIGLASFDTNLYRYVRNNPMNFTDPTGNGPIAVAVCVQSVKLAALAAAMQITQTFRQEISIINTRIKNVQILIKTIVKNRGSRDGLQGGSRCNSKKQDDTTDKKLTYLRQRVEKMTIQKRREGVIMAAKLTAVGVAKTVALVGCATLLAAPTP